MNANSSLTMVIAGFLALSTAGVAGQSAPGHGDHGSVQAGSLAPRLSGLGSLEYQVTTTVPEAQRFFNQGLRLLYAFNHPEALRAFREAARPPLTSSPEDCGGWQSRPPSVRPPRLTFRRWPRSVCRDTKRADGTA